MQKKLFLSYIIIISMVLFISIGSFGRIGYKFINQQGKESYLMQTKMLADAFEGQDFKSQEGYKEFIDWYSKKYNIRITLIDVAGTVIADSENEYLENHATREEVAKALKGEDNTLIRYSETMKQKYAYSAVSVNKDNFHGVIRMSLPMENISTLDDKLIQSIIITFILSLIFAGIIAYIYSRRIVIPIDEITNAAEKISEGDYSIKIYTDEVNRIGKLAKAFNIMTKSLNSTVTSLTQRRNELEAMLSSMNSGVIAVNETEHILFYNDSFLKMIYSNISNTNDNKNENYDLYGDLLYKIIRAPILFEIIGDVRSTKEVQIKEGILDLSSDLLVSITATPFNIYSNSEQEGILLIIDDITNIKKLENIRSEFVSNVTHELKTPLTSIRGFIDTLRNGAIQDTKVAYRFLDIIDVEAERLYNLIQDILLLSEIESKNEVNNSLCNIDDIINESIELTSPTVNTSAVHIIHKRGNHIPPYLCNPDRMKELILNLLDNAIKYTENGEIMIETNSSDTELIINISDTGIGIPKDDIPRIFERFYRVDKGRSRKKGGTGLGLSIVKHIVELYNGRIRIESVENEGTKFEIRLPY